MFSKGRLMQTARCELHWDLETKQHVCVCPHLKNSSRGKLTNTQFLKCKYTAHCLRIMMPFGWYSISQQLATIKQWLGATNQSCKTWAALSDSSGYVSWLSVIVLPDYMQNSGSINSIPPTDQIGNYKSSFSKAYNSGMKSEKPKMIGKLLILHKCYQNNWSQ